MLKEAEYGGYTYVESPRLVFQFKTSRVGTSRSLILAYLLKSITFDKVEVDGVYFRKTSSYDDYKRQVLGALESFINRTSIPFEGEVKYWNSVNWSESTLIVEFKEVRKY